jgi:hypothetical protein
VSVVEEYLVLGLRLGRHVDGLVDAYYGPRELKDEVDAEPLRDPADLAADAEGLTAKLQDGWLRDQAAGLRTSAAVLAGTQLAYADEAEGSYGVRPARPDEDQLRAVHERLAALLPGGGELADRLESWRRTQYVDKEQIVPATRDAIAFMRARTAALVPLPDGERAELEAVNDEPWWAFNYYLGELRSRVVVNVDIPTESGDIVELAAHEVYPGHHTERALKEQHLVRERGVLEETIQLVPTPQAVVAEGIATTGIDVLLDDDGRADAAEVIARHGIAYDVERASAIREAVDALRPASIGAALLIHEDGGSVADAEAYVGKWQLRTPQQAAQSVRFLTDPTWRTYPITYAAGRDLCASYVRGDAARFRTLLTEHVRVGDLIAAAT